MKVSMVVPMYNVAPYIERCARSLFEQTLDDIEYVFVEDCSTDNGLEILMSVLDEYPSRKPHVNIIHHEKNKGIAETKKDGYLGATGEYVICLDSDDSVDLRMAELMYAKAKEKDADMVVCDIYWSIKGVNHLLKSALNGEGDNGINIKEDLLNRRVTPGLCCKLIKRSIITSKEMKWPVGSFAEDVAITIFVTYLAEKIAYVEEPLYYYIYNNTSACYSNSKEKHLRNLRDSKINLEMVFQFLKEKGVYDRYREGVYLHKFYAKKLVMPFANERKFRKLWFDTYPEMNRILFWGDDVYKSSYRQKVWMIAIWLGLYPKYKRRLQSKRFLPNMRWHINDF